MKNVLVVDDDARLRGVLRLLLEDLCGVLEAPDGLAALRLLRENTVSLVLLDITMPGLSGTETLRAIIEGKPGLRVIMLTGEQEIDIAKQTLNLGAAAYITKPFDPATLKAEVRRALGSDASRTSNDTPPWRVAP